MCAVRATIVHIAHYGYAQRLVRTVTDEPINYICRDSVDNINTQFVALRFVVRNCAHVCVCSFTEQQSNTPNEKFPFVARAMVSVRCCRRHYHCLLLLNLAIIRKALFEPN